MLLLRTDLQLVHIWTEGTELRVSPQTRKGQQLRPRSCRIISFSSHLLRVKVLKIFTWITKLMHLKAVCLEKMEGTSTKGTSGQLPGVHDRESCQIRTKTILVYTISYRFKHRTTQIWWCILMVLMEVNTIHKHSNIQWANHSISINIEKIKSQEVKRKQSTWWDIKLQVLVPNLIQKTHSSSLK